MPYATLEIRQINNDIEPLFQVWIRTHVLIEIKDQPGFSDRKLIRQALGEPNSVAPPNRWPVPADQQDDLAAAWEWYIEEYSQFQTPVTQTRAQHVRKAFFDWGQYNFKQLFNTEAATNAYYQLAETALSHEITIEIYSADPSVLPWPWEGLCDGNKDFLGQIMSIERRLLVAQNLPDEEPQEQEQDTFNILLVTCRTVNDVDYRIIGRELTAITNITLLNPPTLEHLKQVLSNNKKRWDVLHFDCHGGWGPLFGGQEQGYILLGDGKWGLTPVTGEQLIDAMGPGTPKHIFLNACRSAMSTANEKQGRDSMATILLRHPKVQDVTAMAYNLSVDAVNHFVSHYYTGLINGLRPSIGLQNGRLAMAQEPYRSCIGGKVLLQDWMVPVIYLKEQQTFDPVYDRAYIKGQGYSEPVKRDTHPYFIGHDLLFYYLDFNPNKNAPIIVIYGLQGQGKTHFLKEYLQWKFATGDTTPAIWIDFELYTGFEEVLHDMMTDLGLGTLQQTQTKQDAINLVVNYLNSNPYRIIWDHLHVANSENRCNTNWKDKDFDAISGFISQLTAGKSAIIAASRTPESWISANNRSATLQMAGLDKMQRWQFINDLMAERDKDGNCKPRLAQEKTAVDNLVDQCEGHPLTMKLVFSKFIHGESAEDLLHYLRGENKRYNYFYEGINKNYRCYKSLECLTDEAVNRVLPFIALFNGVMEEQLVLNMMTKRYGAQGKEYCEAALNQLALLGLLFNKKELHPILTGVLNLTKPESLQDPLYDCLLDAVNEILDRSGAELALSIAAYKQVLEVSIARARVSMKIYDLLKTFYADNNRWKEFYDTADAVVKVFLKTGQWEAAIRHILSMMLFSRQSYQLAKLNEWAEKTDTIMGQLPAAILPAYEIQLLYEKAKMYQVTNRPDDYIALMNEANIKNTHAGEEADARLTALIGYDLAQIAISKGETAQADQQLDNIMAESVTGHSSFFRAQAQVYMHEKNFSEARFNLQRAIVLSKKEGVEINYAMNISLMGELEAQDGNLKKAKQLITQAVDIFEQQGQRHLAGVPYHQLAKYYYLNNFYEEAIDYFMESAICFYEIGDLGTLETIKQNFNVLLSNLTGESALFMKIKWASKGLPAL